MSGYACLNHQLIHRHFVVRHREEPFQAVFGYMKPKSAIQSLQKKNHQKARFVIQLKAASCWTKSKQSLWRSGDLSVPSGSATKQLCAFVNVINIDKFQFPNL